MSADSCQSPEQHTEDNKLVRPKVELHSLLQHAGAHQDIFTMKEVMHYLGQYIMQKKLYDQRQQHIVHCSQDALGRLLGVDSFSVKEPRVLFAMIIKNLVAVKNQDSPPRFTEQHSHSQLERGTDRTTEEAESDSVSSSSERRRRRRRRRRRGDDDNDAAGPSQLADADEDEDEEEEGGDRKRRRSDSFSLTFDNSLSWCVIGGLGNGRDRHSSQSSDVHSVSNQSSVSGPVVPEDSDCDNFSVEFEVESIDSDNYDDEDASVSGEDEVYEVTIIEDEDSFDEDTEITLADYWKCLHCGELNPPLPRNCNRCWALRQDWLPPKPPADQSATDDTRGAEAEENEGLDVPDGKRARTPVLPLTESDASQPQSQPASSSSSQELLLSCALLPSSSSSLSSPSPPPALPSSLSSPSPPPALPLPDLERFNSSEARLPESCLEPCMICQSRPKNGCIVHGRTGHLMSCYTCAKKLKRRNKLCPVCREPIQSVVLTYFC